MLGVKSMTELADEERAEWTRSYAGDDPQTRHALVTCRLIAEVARLKAEVKRVEEEHELTLYEFSAYR